MFAILPFASTAIGHFATAMQFCLPTFPRPHGSSLAVSTNGGSNLRVVDALWSGRSSVSGSVCLSVCLSVPVCRVAPAPRFRLRTVQCCCAGYRCPPRLQTPAVSDAVKELAGTTLNKTPDDGKHRCRAPAMRECQRAPLGNAHRSLRAMPGKTAVVSSLAHLAKHALCLMLPGRSSDKFLLTGPVRKTTPRARDQ
jgi:hypothetical protein